MSEKERTELQSKFEKETGIPAINSDGELDIDYVFWLEEYAKQETAELQRQLQFEIQISNDHVKVSEEYIQKLNYWKERCRLSEKIFDVYFNSNHNLVEFAISFADWIFKNGWKKWNYGTEFTHDIPSWYDKSDFDDMKKPLTTTELFNEFIKQNKPKS